MNIDFVLPGKPAPIGGFKVIYQHASALAKNGHNVTVYHTNEASLNTNFLSWAIISTYFWYQVVVNKWRSYPKRYGLRSKIRYRVIDHSKADLVVIASWQLLETYIFLGNIREEKIVHLAMDFPGYMGPPERILNSWKHEITYIAISKHLKEHIGTVSAPKSKLHYFPASIGYTPKYHKTSKCNKTIIACISSGTYKNLDNLLLLLNILSHKHQIITYSREHRPTGLSNKIIHYTNLTDGQINTLYSESQYAISYSTFEGFGLPAFEAAINDCTLFCTKFLGNEDYWLDDAFIELSGKNIDDDIMLIEDIIAKPRASGMIDRQQLYLRQFLSKYSEQRLIKLYEDIYSGN